MDDTAMTTRGQDDADRVRSLEAENAQLRSRVEESESTIRAIRSGEVDAFVVQVGEGERILSLRGAELTYHAFVERMRDGAVTVAEQGNVLYCNRRFASLLGMSPAQVVGANLIDLVAPDDGYMAEALLRRGMRRESRGEVALVTAAGEPLATYFSAFPMDLEDVRTVCVFVQDLTEINRYKYELEHLVEQRTRELSEANTSLRAISDAKSELLVRVAEELMRPVGSMAGVLDHLHGAVDSLGGDRGSVAVGSDDLGVMEGSVVRLKGLLQDLAVLADIESGTARVAFGTVRPRAVALEAAEALEAAAREKGVEVVVEAPHEDVSFVGDVGRVGRLVETLLLLGVESADCGPVRLSAEVTPDLTARFEVSVPGQPLPAKDVRMLLEGSLAPESTDEISARASALSLWTVLRIAEFLRGRLTVEEHGGERMSFVLTLPV